MRNPMYGQNKNDEAIQDLVDLFSPNQIGQVEGKGFITKKATYSLAGSNTDNSGAIITIGTNTSVWGGFVRVEGADGSGNLDFDMGLTAGAGDFGTGYGLQDDGVYAVKAHEFVASSTEDIHLSFDANTYASDKTLKITVFLIFAVAPASS